MGPEFMALEVIPDSLIRIEVGRVKRQIVHLEGG
jgi:hypothetical protein